MGGDERPDPGWHDDQPQGRCEDEQSAGELGVGDDERVAPPRAGCSVGSATSPYRLETPEDDANGGGRSGNPAQTSERRARDRHSRGLLHEAEGNQRNLHGQDLDAHLVWPLPNIWLGTSVSDQTSADKRIPDLLATPAAVRFVSAEPLLGAVDLTGWFYGADIPCAACPKDVDCECGWQIWRDLPDSIAPGSLDWVIVGGESGKNARPMHPDWARSLRDQCEGAGVAFFFKQWGEWISIYDRDRDDPDWRNCPKSGDWDKKRYLNLEGGQGFHGDKLNMMRRIGKARAGRLLDGREWNQMPGDV
ncbi:MAG: phage Gp37/Gp68 family protein [Alphaproteobacteria bacterium]|nr:phage Gp37/Gp68 family protein [Alphaproteobacteria bacterium]